MYIFIKISLGFLGFISLAIFFLTLIFTVKFMFFTDPLIGKEIFNYEGVCGFNNSTSLANKKCQNLMTIYWLFVVGKRKGWSELISEKFPMASLQACEE